MSAAEQERDEKELSWDDPEIRQAQPSYDPEADANAYKLPPDTQDYLVKLKLGERGVYPKKSEKSGVFAVAEIEMYFVDPGNWWDGKRVGFSEYVNSIKQESTGTSSMVNLLRLIKMQTDEKVPGSLALSELGELFKQTLEQEPIVGARFLWTATSRDVQEAHKNKDDERHHEFSASRYRDGAFLTGMKNFPQDDKGEPKTEVADPITQQEVRARLRLVKFLERK